MNFDMIRYIIIDLIIQGEALKTSYRNISAVIGDREKNVRPNLRDVEGHVI